MSERLLLLAYTFPPTAAPEAFLSAKRMGALPGYQVDVVSATPPPGWFTTDHSLDAYVESRFGKVHQLGQSNLPHLRQRTARRLGPDDYRMYNPRALRLAGRLAQQRRYSAIVTWSQMHSVHLVGLALKRRLDLPWFAHLSDPWADNPFSALGSGGRRREARRERQVFDAADRLLFTSEYAVELSMSKYPAAWRQKTSVLPHGFDPNLYPARLERERRDVVLRYIGAFYGPRTPQPLIQALRALTHTDPDAAANVRVEVVGFVEPSIVDTWELATLPDGMLRFLPPVDYTASLGLMTDADGLLVVDAPGRASPFLPSKLIDYIGAARPVAALTPPGPAADVTRALGGFVADPDDTVGACQALRSLIDAAQKEQAFGDDAVRREFEVERVGAAMARLLQVTEPSKSASAP